MPSAFGAPSPSGDRRQVDRSVSFSSANLVGGGGGATNAAATMTPAHTAPVDAVGSYGSVPTFQGLGVVPENSGVDGVADSPPQSDAVTTNREWASKVVNLCNAVLHDPHVDEVTKEQAIMLRCDAHEQLLS